MMGGIEKVSPSSLDLQDSQRKYVPFQWRGGANSLCAQRLKEEK